MPIIHLGGLPQLWCYRAGQILNLLVLANHALTWWWNRGPLAVVSLGAAFALVEKHAVVWWIEALHHQRNVICWPSVHWPEYQIFPSPRRTAIGGTQVSLSTIYTYVMSYTPPRNGSFCLKLKSPQSLRLTVLTLEAKLAAAMRKLQRLYYI